jgi:hypothetical protein
MENRLPQTKVTELVIMRIDHMPAVDAAAPVVGVWPWLFCYLPDALIKGATAALILRLLLGANPVEMSERERHMFSMCGISTATEPQSNETEVSRHA